MKRLVLAVGGFTAALAVGIGTGNADPSDFSTLNVVGEPYAKAVAILRAKAFRRFGGAVGSDLPQAQCVVSSQKALSTRKMSLMLDCTAEDAAQQPATTPASGAPGAPAAETARPPRAHPVSSPSFRPGLADSTVGPR